jgi:hypothetical protein
MEGCGRGVILRYYPGINLERLRKTMKNLSPDTRSRVQNLIRDPRIRSRSVNHLITMFGVRTYVLRMYLQNI